MILYRSSLPNYYHLVLVVVAGCRETGKIFKKNGASLKLLIVPATHTFSKKLTRKFLESIEKG